MTDQLKAEAACLLALRDKATPGPWHIQYGDDFQHMCCTAISTKNSRVSNDGQFSDDDCDALVALTYHQLYPQVMPECNDANAAFIASIHSAMSIIEGLLAENEGLLSLVSDSAEFWAHYSSINEGEQDDLNTERHQMLERMNAAIRSTGKPTTPASAPSGLGDDNGDST